AARRDAPRPAPAAQSALWGGHRHYIADLAMEQTMRPLLSLLLSLVLSDAPNSSRRPRHRREARRRFAPRGLHCEALEDRTVPTAAALRSNAVSWWNANSTANDALGLNNATLSNVTYTTGEVGKAFSFNGTNGWAALGDPSSLAFTSSFSIEGWVKVN